MSCCKRSSVSAGGKCAQCQDQKRSNGTLEFPPTTRVAPNSPNPSGTMTIGLLAKQKFPGAGNNRPRLRNPRAKFKRSGGNFVHRRETKWTDENSTTECSKAEDCRSGACKRSSVTRSRALACFVSFQIGGMPILTTTFPRTLIIDRKSLEK